MRHVELDNEFGLADFVSFLILLRVPSETLLIRIADEDGRVAEFPPSGLRNHRMYPSDSGGEPMLVAKSPVGETSNADAYSVATASVARRGSGEKGATPRALFRCIGFGRN